LADGAEVSREYLERSPLTTQQMLSDVAGHFGLSINDLLPDRSKTQSAIRAIAMWALREQYEFSYPELGAMFRKDHTTVMHNVSRVGLAVARFDQGEDDWIGRIARSVLLGGKLAAE
jgi:chromosomal replication initiation ATPase DnaA